MYGRASSMAETLVVWRGRGGGGSSTVQGSGTGEWVERSTRSRPLARVEVLQCSLSVPWTTLTPRPPISGTTTSHHLCWTPLHRLFPLSGTLRCFAVLCSSLSAFRSARPPPRLIAPHTLWSASSARIIAVVTASLSIQLLFLGTHCAPPLFSSPLLLFPSCALL